MQPFRVAIYSPDRHVTYDGSTTDKIGVGGGITARIRIARSLAGLGHDVSVIANTPKDKTFDGVRYLPLDEVRRIACDVLVINSSGGALDVMPLLDLDVESRLRAVWVQGIDPPKGLDEVGMSYLYAPSNFIRARARDRWGVHAGKIYVTHNGVPEREPPKRGRRPERSLHRLIYNSHPSKGLDAAIEVVRLLRAGDDRFELHVYGGNQLWGQADKPPPGEKGVVYHGLVGQHELGAEMERSGFSMNLQARLEPFALAPAEAMACGCIVVASPVGGYPELVRHGYNGFLVAGDHTAAETQRRAADVIRAVVARPEFAEYLGRNARTWPMDWDTLARAWAGHWEWALGGAPEPRTALGIDACRDCGGPFLALADGHHCASCGFYTRDGRDTLVNPA
jgi:glycosyltransferase involved in cell wall biosynthesis